MKKLAATLLFLFTFTAHSGLLQGQSGFTTSHDGQCSETDRQGTVNNADAQFNLNWRTCGKSTNGSARGTTECLKNRYPSLSTECAQCFGNYVGCARSHCWTQCWRNPDGAPCAECSVTHCKANLISCTGIPDEELPR